MGVCKPYLGTQRTQPIPLLRKLKADNEKWEAYVAPILGKTDTIIFAFGADIGGWEDILLIIRNSSIIRAEAIIITAM